MYINIFWINILINWEVASVGVVSNKIDFYLKIYIYILDTVMVGRINSALLDGSKKIFDKWFYKNEIDFVFQLFYIIFFIFYINRKHSFDCKQDYLELHIGYQLMHNIIFHKYIQRRSNKLYNIFETYK